MFFEERNFSTLVCAAQCGHLINTLSKMSVSFQNAQARPEKKCKHRLEGVACQKHQGGSLKLKLDSDTNFFKKVTKKFCQQGVYLILDLMNVLG